MRMIYKHNQSKTIIRKLGWILLPFAFFLMGMAAFAQPVDCSRPALIAERFICNNEALLQIDKALAIFNEKHGATKLFSSVYTGYTSERDACTYKSCVEGVLRQYESLYQDITKTEVFSPIHTRREYENILAYRPHQQTPYHISTQPWTTFLLTTFESEPSYREIAAATFDDGVLYVFVVDVNGKIYEFADNTDEHFLVFQYDKSILVNSVQGGFSGIQEDHFYFQAPRERNSPLSNAYRYKLGSKKTAKLSTIVYCGIPNSEDRNRWGIIKSYPKITVSYWGDDQEHPPDILLQEDMIVALDGTFIWNPFLPVLYFTHIPGDTGIWRSDLFERKTVLIVPDEDAIDPVPIFIGHREAVLYLKDNELRIAFAPPVASEQTDPKQEQN